MMKNISPRPVSAVETIVRAAMLACPLLPCLLFVAILTGCEASPADNPAASDDGERPAPIHSSSTPVAATARIETWEACFLRNTAAASASASKASDTSQRYAGLSRIGFVHNITGPIEHDGKACIRTTSRSVSSFQRLGQAMRQEIIVTAISKQSGELVSLESSMSGGDAPTTSKLTIDGAKATLITTTAGKSASQTLPWKTEYRGPFAVEESLREQPMKTGDKRELTMFLPVLNVLGEVQLEAIGREVVPDTGLEEGLIRIASSTKIGPQSLSMLLWQNKEGRIQKNEVLGIGQVNFSVSREEALRDPEGAQLDLMLTSTIKLTEPLVMPAGAKRAIYLATFRGDAGSAKLEEGLTQTVEKLGNDQLRITVSAPSAIESLTSPQTPPTDDDKQPNALIESADPLVVKLAADVTPEESDPWLVAIALEKQVHSTIAKKNFSQAFATAAEAARMREGDCTEHAVLLAAMCRSRGIPARVAFGVVYYPPQQGFLYHMWNEVWTGDRWMPLDATMGQGSVGVDRIKLASSSLAGASPYAAMLPVLDVFGRLDLEVIEVE